MKYVNSPFSLRGLFLTILLMSLFPTSSIGRVLKSNNRYSTVQREIKRKVFDTVIDRIDSLIIRTVDNPLEQDKKIASWLTTQLTDGSWATIDYKDRHRTIWDPSNHILQLRSIATAYINPQSKYYQQEVCYQAVEKGLNYWYQEDPRSDNWFMQQISSPQCVGEILCLMHNGKELLPTKLIDKLLQRMVAIGARPDQPNPKGVGANKIDIATHWMYRGALTQNDSVFKFGIQQMMAPIRLTTGEGIQPDYSHHQHGNQLYIGGYGAVLLNRIPKLLLYLKGTDYFPPQQQIEIFSKFIGHTLMRVVRGKYYMFNVCGRSMARKGALNRSSDIPNLQILSLVDTVRAPFYQDCIDRISRKKPASYHVPKLLTHYWRSDYTLYTSPLWNFDVRMESTRTCRHENGNGENLKGYFLSNGATCIARTGSEYEGSMPYWDWSMIPGTTAPHLEKKNIPVPNPWGHLGSSQFAGGVSTGLYGVTAYAYSDVLPEVKTRAKKSYFILGSQAFCMGSDITSESEQPLYTTLNQCKPHGALEVDRKNHAIIQDQIAYYIPTQDNWDFRIAKQQGDWHDIVNRYSSQIVSGDIFKLWINHGVAPKRATYQYEIIPGIATLDSLKKYLAEHPIQVVRCDEKAHAIIPYMNDTKLLAVAFEGTSIDTADMTVSVDHPCFLIIKDQEIIASVPNGQYAKIELNIKTKETGSVNEYTLNFDNSPTHLGESIHVTR